MQRMKRLPRSNASNTQYEYLVYGIIRDSLRLGARGSGSPSVVRSTYCLRASARQLAFLASAAVPPLFAPSTPPAPSTEIETFPDMASSLPTVPRVVFTIIEPISLHSVAGFLGAVHDAAWFIAEQVPQAAPIVVTENSLVVAWQLGNLYLLLAFIGLAVLWTSSELKVVRAYLFALWLGDIGHVAFSCYGLGWDRVMDPAEWNAMAWGNVAMTASQACEYEPLTC
ncbi:hypothetical protein G7046_g4672 [Stylonectria norvegica]|nr:hypothetical protein G7046_g4672 [Stylonectria norvegica]